AEELEEFYDWHVGDTLMNKEKKTLYRVVFRSGEFVVGASANTSMGLGHLIASTRVKLHEEDWRLKVEPPKEKTVEISMADIRREFGISANEKIIIKD
ncbi:MAG: hypothetical protein LBG17_04570, partial [Bacteroidales bacterium]|nr:hypothetical protein [Bacteroidales bacterium]